VVNRGNWTPFQLFIAGIDGLAAVVRRQIVADYDDLAAPQRRQEGWTSLYALLTRGNVFPQHTPDKVTTLDLLYPCVCFPVAVRSCRDGDLDSLILVAKIRASAKSVPKKKVPPQFRPIRTADIQVMRYPRSLRARVGSLPVLRFKHLTPLDPLVAVVPVSKAAQAGLDARERLISRHDNVNVHDWLRGEAWHGRAAYVFNSQNERP
jgi:hypothetical protein